jgi:hypothetical protein
MVPRTLMTPDVLALACNDLSNIFSVKVGLPVLNADIFLNFSYYKNTKLQRNTVFINC